MIRIKLLMIVGGIVLLVFGIQEYRLASEAAQTAQSITCADLAAKGPGANAHVNVTNALICEQAFVYEAKKNTPDTWNKVWVPAVPIDGEFVKTVNELMLQTGGKLEHLPPPTDIRVLIKTSSVHNAGELEAFSKTALTSGVTGLVTNKIESLGAKEKKILEENYPGIDFTKCYIVDHERKPADASKLAAMIGGGALITLIGGGWTLAGMRSKSEPKPLPGDPFARA